MSYKVLEQNGVENEVADGGALNNFCAGNRDGIIAGVLSECALSAAENGVTIAPGLLIVCGVRIKITASEMLLASSVPVSATRYQIIAQVTFFSDGDTEAEFFLQSNAPLKRDAIYSQGYGTYQAEIGSFTHNPDGSISDITKEMDLLFGDCVPQEDDEDTAIEYELADNTDKTFKADGITSVKFIIPPTVRHGFFCGVNIKTGATPVTVQQVVNNSQYPLKYMNRGYKTDNFVSLPTNCVVLMAFICDGINLYCYIAEAEN